MIEGKIKPDYARAVSISTAAVQKELVSLAVMAVSAPINAKKLIEDEPRDPAKNLGKNSERHKASVVGDTVGDPLKDIAGPALDPMIKVVNLVSLIIAPIVVQYKELGAIGWVVVLVLVAGFVWSIWQSKKEVSLPTSAIKEAATSTAK